MVADVKVVNAEAGGQNLNEAFIVYYRRDRALPKLDGGFSNGHFEDGEYSFFTHGGVRSTDRLGGLMSKQLWRFRRR